MALIKIKRGLKANIPALEVGEPGFCTDTKELFVGSPDGNKLVGEGTFLKLSGGTLTGTLTLPLAAPTHPAHAANKAYVDNVASGLDVKASVKCVATVNQPIVAQGGHNAYAYEYPNPVTIDGYTLRKDDRILLVGQENRLQNGIFYVKTVGNGTVPCMLSRAADATDGTLTGGTFVFVEKGTTYADTGWVCTTDDDPLIIGSTLIEFTQFTGAGSSSFVALSDTPSSYALQGGKLVRVKSNASGLEFVDPATVGRTKFIKLDDCPSAYSNGSIVVSGANGIQFANNKVFGGLFSDVPTTMGDQHLMLAVGSSGRLEWIAVGGAANGGRTPLSADWGYVHNAATHTVHGAPSGKNLLHEDSVIDGGTF